MGVTFFPRGGSAHATRALARQLGVQGWEVTLVTGSISGANPDADARQFYEGIDVRPVDFSPALASADPMRFAGPIGIGPMHASFEDRPDAQDRVFAELSDDDLEIQVGAWTLELAAAGGADADVLYLHHLTPLNEAAARDFGHVPVVGHVHGSELLMLERVEAGAPASWQNAAQWGERLRAWAQRCGAIVVNSPAGRQRAATLLRLQEDDFALIPNGFDPEFAPGEIDRRAFWRRHLVDEPRGWLPGREAGSAAYGAEELEALEGTVLISVGRFTEVKHLPVLISAFAKFRERSQTGATALVLVGGYPDEWEGEHPAETIERLGAKDVFLAGWHGHDELPSFLNASDVLVHPAAPEQFGQVIVEAMACGLAPIAANIAGPASIVEDGETGWLLAPADERELAEAIAEAVTDPGERLRRGRAARAAALESYSWSSIGEDLSALLERVVRRG